MKTYQTVSMMFIPISDPDVLTVSDSAPLEKPLDLGESGTGISIPW